MLRRHMLIFVIWIAVLFFFTTSALAEVLVDTVWVRRYNGPGNLGDAPFAIALDTAGNVYVTGTSVGIESEGDYATVKYYLHGDTAWVRRYDGGPGRSDVAYRMAVDDSCNVYVTGHAASSDTSSDYVTIKYYYNGDTAWVRRYHGPGNDQNNASAIAIDDGGHVYVTGGSHGDGTYLDYATIKYYSNGDTAWVRRYDGPGSDRDFAYAVAVDASGNVYVTGLSHGNGTSSDFATIKYYPNGDTAWVRRYNGPANGEDFAQAMTVDDAGNVYVTGRRDGPNESDKVLTTIRYLPNGDTAWIRQYCSGEGRRIALDSAGNIYVTGNTIIGSENRHAYVTIRYFPSGDTAWIRTYHASEDSDDDACAIALDGNGNVYVTGWSSEPDRSTSDFVTVKYNSNGDKLWLSRYDVSENSRDYAWAIAVDDSGDVHVTGPSYGYGYHTGDYATVKYVETGFRGDVNGDSSIDIADIVYLVNFLFREGPPPDLFEAADANCSGFVTVGDLVFLVNYLYKEGPPPDCW